MEAMCEDLRTDLGTRPAAILARHGLRVVNFNDLTEEDARCPHIAATRETVAKVNAWVAAIRYTSQSDPTSICRGSSCWVMVAEP